MKANLSAAERTRLTALLLAALEARASAKSATLLEDDDGAYRLAQRESDEKTSAVFEWLYSTIDVERAR